jgi:hypothetical protein
LSATLATERLLQLGVSTVPEAEVNPAQLTMDPPWVPTVPPMSLMRPDGKLTVTVQDGLLLALCVCWPPGQCQNKLLDTLVTEKVNFVLAGQAAVVVVLGSGVQTRLPLMSNPLTYWPLGQDWPAAAWVPAGPWGPRRELLVSTQVPFWHWYTSPVV